MMTDDFAQSFVGPGSGETADQAFQRGLAAQERGDPQGAIAAYRQAVAMKPDFAGALCNLAIALKQIGHANEAIKTYRQAVSVAPRFAEAHYNLGIVLDLVGRREEAVASYRTTIELKPDFPPAHGNLGKSLQELGDFEGALSAYRKALEIEPNYLRVLLNYSSLLIDLERAQEALSVTEKALSLDPDNLEGLEKQARVQLLLERPLAALATAERAWLRHPDAYAALDIKVAALWALERPDAVKETYRAYITRQPKAERAYAKLARIHHEEGALEEALAVTDRCLELLPGNTRALATRVACLTALGRLQPLRQIHDLDRFIRTTHFAAAPGYPDIAHFNQALADHILAHPTLRADPSGLSTRSGRHTGELLIEPKGPIAVLEQMIVQAVMDYRRALPLEPTHPFLGVQPERWSMTIWSVVLGAEGYQVPHMHPSGWLSGVYYVAVPQALESATNSHDGWIEFGRPPQLAPDATAPDLRMFQPKPGLMLLFPSYVYHRTIPTGSDQRRISIAFDVMFENARPAQPGGG